MLKSIWTYLGSKPTNGLDLAWRIILLVVLVLGILRLERIRRGQLDTQHDVKQVATAVAVEIAETPAPGVP